MPAPRAGGAAWGGPAVPALAGLDGRYVERPDTTPFIALCFVLLVMMIVLTPELSDGCWWCPRAATASVLPRGVVRLAVDREGRLWLRGEPSWITRERSVPLLRERLAASRDPETVYVLADNEVPYPAVLVALDAARHAGARYIGFLANPPRPHRPYLVR